MTTTEGTVPRRVVRLSAAGGVLIVTAAVVAVLAVRVFVAAHRPLSWAAAAVVAAVVLDPIVDVLAERIRRVPAVLLCFLVAGGAVLGVAYVVVDDLDTAVERLQEAAPSAAEEIEDRDDRLGQLARDADLVGRVTDAVEGLEDRFGGGGDVLRSTALTAPAYLVGAILTVFLLSYGPRIGSSAIDQLPADRRARTAEVLNRATDQARTAGLLTLADAAVVGLLAAGAARLLDLPAPAALGLVAGLFAVLPHVGLVLGTFPLALFALALHSALAAAIVAATAIGLQAVDSFVIRPRINRHVRIGLLAPFVVVVLANAVYGIGAAAYGLAYAIFGLAVLDQISADDRPAAGGEPGALAAAET